MSRSPHRARASPGSPAPRQVGYNLIMWYLFAAVSATYWYLRIGLRDPALLAGLTLVVYAGFMAMFPVVVVAAKWVLIGRFRAGSYPLWGGFYLRFWLYRVRACPWRAAHLSPVPSRVETTVSADSEASVLLGQYVVVVSQDPAAVTVCN